MTCTYMTDQERTGVLTIDSTPRLTLSLSVDRQT